MAKKLSPKEIATLDEQARSNYFQIENCTLLSCEQVSGWKLKLNSVFKDGGGGVKN